MKTSAFSALGATTLLDFFESKSAGRMVVQTVKLPLTETYPSVSPEEKTSPRIVKDTTSEVFLRPSSVPQGEAERVYPHLFGEGAPASACYRLIKRALEAAERAATSCSTKVDSSELSSNLTEIALCCQKASSEAGFNKFLGSILGFLRRAMLSASPLDLPLSAFMCLEQSLRRIVKDPMLSLGDAAEIADLLAEEGWKGDSEVVNELLEAIFDGHIPMELAAELGGRSVNSDTFEDVDEEVGS